MNVCIQGCLDKILSAMRSKIDNGPVKAVLGIAGFIQVLALTFNLTLLYLIRKKMYLNNAGYITYQVTETEA